MSHHALDGHEPGSHSDIEMHHVLLAALGMNVKGQRLSRPRNVHAVEG